MRINNMDDCFKARLLRKINPDMDKSKRSLELAKKRLEQGEKGVKLKIYHLSILEAYMTMFHSARALLYKDGIQEKSHYAIYIYLREKYSDKIPINIINLLNIHRTERHEAMYGLEYEPNKDDAKTALEDAKVFLREIEKFLNL
ncbi:MAG: HEPN domain-containing protein [Candidatus Woesearchaeota archaeon]